MIKITSRWRCSWIRIGVTIFEIPNLSATLKALAENSMANWLPQTRAITEDGSIEIVTPDHEDALPILRQLKAHLFAQAACALPRYPLGVVQLSKIGFYYDTDNQAGQISNEDLPLVMEEEMKKIRKKTSIYSWSGATKDEAWNSQNDPAKLELTEEHSEDEGVFGPYTVKGEGPLPCPHVPSTGRIQIFHLL